MKSSRSDALRHALPYLALAFAVLGLGFSGIFVKNHKPKMLIGLSQQACGRV